MMISEHLSVLKYVFSIFCTADVASDDESSKQKSKSYMLTDASLDPWFISFGFSTLGPVKYQWRQSCHRLHSYVDLYAKTRHSRARLTVRHASN